VAARPGSDLSRLRRTPVVYAEGHRLHTTDVGTWVGLAVPSLEGPDRIEVVRRTLEELGHDVVPAAAHDDTVLETVHDPQMVRYMETAHEQWLEAGYDVEPGQPNVVGYAFPTPSFLGDLPLTMPKSAAARAGVYAMDTMTQIGPGTFRGARAAVDAAQTAADMVVSGHRSAYAACRPPGHHAGRAFFGGSCYLNNAAVAATVLGGLDTVTIVDLDAHHGNGTQEIFYRRGDVGYGSVHVDPAAGWFPHFVGHSTEVGLEGGRGANLNIPLPPGSGDGPWLDGVDRLLEFARKAGSQALVVSLGVDAAAEDPESPLRITESGYLEAGKRIASLDLPTVFVQEGGYVLETIGGLVAAALGGFDASS